VISGVHAAAKALVGKIIEEVAKAAIENIALLFSDIAQGYRGCF
jgi:hypothetical protein